MIISKKILQWTQYCIASLVILSCVFYGGYYHNATKRAEKGAKYGATDLIVFYVAGGSIIGTQPISPVELYKQPKIRPLIQSINPSSGTHFLYLPPAAVLFVPLGLLPLKLLIPSWTFVNILLFIGVYYFIIYYLIQDRSPWRLRYSLLLAALMISSPMLSFFRTGQINFIVLGLLMVMIYSIGKRKSVLGGISLALATTIKVFPGIFLLYALLKKQYKTVLVSIITGSSLILLSLPFFGIEGWKIFLTERLGEIAQGSVGSVYKSISLHGSWEAAIRSGTFDYLGISHRSLSHMADLPFTILTMSLLVVIGVIIYRERKILTLHSIILDYSLLIVFVLLTSNIVHKQYVFWLIPLLLYCIHWPLKKHYLPLHGAAILSFILLFWDRALHLPYLFGGIVKPVTCGIVLLFIISLLLRTQWFKKIVPISYENS